MDIRNACRIQIKLVDGYLSILTKKEPDRDRRRGETVIKNRQPKGQAVDSTKSIDALKVVSHD